MRDRWPEDIGGEDRGDRVGAAYDTQRINDETRDANPDFPDNFDLQVVTILILGGLCVSAAIMLIILGVAYL